MKSGARFHQSGCMGCIGMGQAPSSGSVSLRTMPRNFPGRSGTKDDRVFLCSPETAAVSALNGKITDPRVFGRDNAYPVFDEPDNSSVNSMLLIKPDGKSEETGLEKGPNIKILPEFYPPEDSFRVPVLLSMGDHISTDEILPAGAEVLPLRSNVEAISRFCYRDLEEDFYRKSVAAGKSYGGHFVVAGENYAQGSSREHAAMAPRYLGQRAVIARSYARIGYQNLINFGIIPLLYSDPGDHDWIKVGHILSFTNMTKAIRENGIVRILNETTGKELKTTLSLTPHQRNVLLAGGLINLLKNMN